MMLRVVSYLVGVALGEVCLLAWWGMTCGRRVTPRDYLAEKWGTALFSGAFAAAGTVASAEGVFSRIAVAWFPSFFVGWDAASSSTVGLSLLSGAAICFFAHTIVWMLVKKFGIPMGGAGNAPMPPPPPAG